MSRIQLSAPDVGELEERYLLAALRSGWVAPVGPDLDAFEQELAARVGVPHAVALSSGTAGLHLALAACGVRPGDAVLVPTLTFVATANAARYLGAEPVFVDCDPDTGTVDVELLAQLLARPHGRRIAAVVPVDLFGTCADYAELLPLCADHGVPVVEDAAEALGAHLRGQPAGSFGRAAVFSFNGNKIATSSGGGALVSADPQLVARCRYLASQARQPVPHYEHTELGWNYRLSNLLAALGRAQLARLDELLARRRALRERYRKLFAPAPGVRIVGDRDGGNCWLTVLAVQPTQAGWSAGELAGWLAARDIETRPVFKPLHLQPLYAGAPAVLTGAAQRLYATGLALPSGSSLDDAQVDRVLTAVDEFLTARLGPGWSS